MKEITMDLFCDSITDLIGQLRDSQMPNIEKAAAICADSIAQGGVVHVFGSGHSVGFGMEMREFPGSLVPIHLIQRDDFVLAGKVSLQEFKDPVNVFERRSGIADKLYDLYDVRPADCFIIISNSGINGLVIDMAITARQRGHKVIVVTSWQHTNAEPSRHPSGKKLYELSDVMIDNCGPRGDAMLPTEGIEKICSASAITGAFIAQSISIQTAALLAKRGLDVPVLIGGDDPAAKEHDRRLLDSYRGRI